MGAVATAEVVASAVSPPRKLRILCLHGYLQSAEVFRSRIGSMRKALKSRAEFLFLDAPHLVAAEAADGPAVAAASDAPAGRSWWEWRDTEPGTRPSRAAEYSGWEASQAAIQAALEEHAPVDGLLGFSQGATAAALFLAHASAPGGGAAALPVGWAVLIAGFLPRDPVQAGILQSAGLRLPSLHVTGAQDALVPSERSEALARCFDEAGRRVHGHPGAHMVPTCSGAFKADLVAFFDEAEGGRAAG